MANDMRYVHQCRNCGRTWGHEDCSLGRAVVAFVVVEDPHMQSFPCCSDLDWPGDPWILSPFSDPLHESDASVTVHIDGYFS